MRQSARAPLARALGTETAERAASGVKSMIGIVPMNSRMAVIGPISRSGSCSAWLSPNRGCFGTQVQSVLPGSMKPQARNTNRASAKALPSASARLEALCAPPSPAARTNSELWITSV